jgi:hypothetical protein
MIAVQRVSGTLLILSSIIFLVAGFMFTARVLWKLEYAQTRTFFIVERSAVMASFLVSLLGLVLLKRQLQASGDALFVPFGLTLYMAAVVLVLVFESYGVAHTDYAFPPIVFVALAFLGQAAFGASILQTGYLASWTGWFTIIWNLGWLVILPIARPQDMYYPWLHFTAPLVIGIVMLLKG